MKEHEIIRQYRLRHRISQKSLANHLGFTAAHLCELEKGKGMHPDKVARILQAITELSKSQPTAPDSLQNAVDAIVKRKK